MGGGTCKTICSRKMCKMSPPFIHSGKKKDTRSAWKQKEKKGNSLKKRKRQCGEEVKGKRVNGMRGRGENMEAKLTDEKEKSQGGEEAGLEMEAECSEESVK